MLACAAKQPGQFVPKPNFCNYTSLRIYTRRLRGAVMVSSLFGGGSDARASTMSACTCIAIGTYTRFKRTWYREPWCSLDGQNEVRCYAICQSQTFDGASSEDARRSANKGLIRSVHDGQEESFLKTNIMATSLFSGFEVQDFLTDRGQGLR